MAGFRSAQNMRVAARAAIRNLRVLNMIADSYGDIYGGEEAPDTEEIMSRLERNDVEGIAQALPSLMAQVLGEEQQ
jgi:hypothetical protein